MADLLSWLGGVGNNIKNAWEDLTPWQEEDEKRRKQIQTPQQPQLQVRPATSQPNLTVGNAKSPSLSMPGITPPKPITIPKPVSQTLPIAQAKPQNLIAPTGKPSAVDEFNRMDVYQQRQKLADLQGLANRKVFNTAEDVKNAQWAKGQLQDIERNGVKKDGNPLTFAQDFIGGIGHTAGLIPTSVADTLQQQQRGQKLTNLYDSGQINKQQFYGGAQNILQNSIDRKIDVDANGNIVGRTANPLEFAGKFIREGADTGLTFSPVGAGYKTAAQLGVKAALPLLAKEGTAYTVANTGNDILQGRPITPGSVAANALMSFGGAAVGAGLGNLKPHQVADLTPQLIQRVQQLPSVARNVANPTNIHPAIVELNNHLTLLRQADEQMAKQGLSPNSATRINNFKAQKAVIDEIAATRKRIGQAGFARVPFGKDPEPHLTQFYNEQIASHGTPKEFLDNTVNSIWEANKKGQGVDTSLVPEDAGSGIAKRISVSNNSPLYQAFYKEYGKAPTKAAIRDMVEQHLGLKGSGDYKNLLTEAEVSPFDADIYRALADREAALNAKLTNTPEGSALSKSSRGSKRSEAPSTSLRGEEQTGKTASKEISSSKSSVPSKTKQIGIMDSHASYTPNMKRLIAEAQKNGDVFPYTKMTPEEQAIVNGSLREMVDNARVSQPDPIATVRRISPETASIMDRVVARSVKTEAKSSSPTPKSSARASESGARSALAAKPPKERYSASRQSKGSPRGSSRENTPSLAELSQSALKGSHSPSVSKSPAPRQSGVTKTSARSQTTLQNRADLRSSSDSSSSKQSPVQPKTTPPSRQLSTGRPSPQTLGSRTKRTKYSSPRSKERQKASPRNSSSYTNGTTESIDVNSYIKSQAKAQDAARKASSMTKGQKIKSTLKSKLVDDLSPIEDTLNKSLKNSGVKLAPDQHITQQLDRAIRADTIAGQYMKDNGLDTLIQSVKNPKAFDQYLIARHAKDLERRGIKTGRDAAADSQVLKKLAPEYEEQAKGITAYTRKMLDTAADYGLISKDLAAALKKEYPNYVPLNRIFSEEEVANRFHGTSAGLASKSTQKTVQRIKGSEREIESPLGSVISKSQDLINEGERNKAAKMLAGYKDLPDNPFSLRELKPDEAVGEKSTIAYLDNGRVRRFETTPEVAAAAKALNRQQMNILIKMLSVPTRILRLGATGANSGFALANLAKDLVSAAINSKHPLRASLLNPGVAKKAFGTAFYHHGKGYDEFIREGAGGTRWDIARDAPKLNVKRIRADKNFATKTLHTIARPQDWLRGLEDTIGRTEELTRALQYYGNKEAALEKGMSGAQARSYGAKAARENTVNFARHGEYGQVLNSVLPYLNAGIQGSRTFVRNVKERPAQTAAKVAILSTLPAVTVTAWNLSDPKRRAAYDDIPDYEKQNNIIIVPPNPVKDPKTGRWNVVKIPVSQEIANLNNIARTAVEGAYGEKSIDAKSVLADLIGTTTSLNAQSSRQIANQVTPQALKPLIENLTNQNLFTGNQIVPNSQKNLPAKDQYGNYTSQTAKSLGNLTNLSPRQIDNFIKTTTGGAGQTALHYSDKLLGAGENARGTSLENSISDRFYGAASKPASDVIEDKFNKYKQQIINSPEYKNASQYDKSRMLNRLENDLSAVEYNQAGFGSGKLTTKQKSLMSDGFKLDTYTNLDAKGGVTIASNISKPSADVLSKYNSMSSDERQKWFNDQKDAEYQYYKAKYENDKANGDISSIQDITRKKALAKDKVGSVYPKTVRDLYSLSKANIAQYLSTKEKGVDKEKMFKQLVAYDQALYNAGLTSYLKFKYGLGSGRGGGGRKSSGLKASATLESLIKSTAAIKPPTTTSASAPKAKQYTPARLTAYKKPIRPKASVAKISVRKGIA